MGSNKELRRYTVKPHDPSGIRDDRSVGHRFVFSQLVSDDLNSVSPRRDSNALWNIDESGVMTIQSSQKLESYEDYLDTRVSYHDGTKVNITVDIAVLYNPKIHVPDELWEQGFRVKQGGRKTKVPSEMIDQWFIAKMTHVGLDVGSYSRGDYGYINTGKGKGSFTTPHMTFNAECTVIDGDALEQAIRNGVGRAKNYGLGMMTVVEKD